MKGNGRSSPKRLFDYICLVGSKQDPGGGAGEAGGGVESDQQAGYEEADLLRRFPLEDHPDFPLPSNIASFCQPEGHLRTSTRISNSATLTTSASSDIHETDLTTDIANSTSISPSEVTTFVFTLTDKDSNVTRYAVCHNFFRQIKNPNRHSNKRNLSNNGYLPIDNDNGGISDEEDDSIGALPPKNFPPPPRIRGCSHGQAKHYSLTSICIISHFQFFSNFKECALAFKRLVTVCNQVNTTMQRQRMHSDLDAWNILLHPSKQQQQSPETTAASSVAPLPIGKKSRKSPNLHFF